MRITPHDDLQALIVPGAIIDLGPGRYTGAITIDQPGVRLLGGEGVEFWRAWITVQAADVAIAGITFHQSPRTSVVMAAGAHRTSIRDCSFLACGFPEGGVTVWLGEGVSDCSIAGCTFDTLGLVAPRHLRQSHAYDIAIMSAQVACTGHRLSANTIRSYCYGMQLGCSGQCQEIGGHLIEGNAIVAPRADGIHVKQARCQVRGNTVVGARRYGMSARAGFSTVFHGNILSDCTIGIRVLGRDHEVTANRFERCRRFAVLLPAADGDDHWAAANTLVSGNTMVDCGGCDVERQDQPGCAGILLASGEAQRLGANTIVGGGEHLIDTAGAKVD